MSSYGYSSDEALLLLSRCGDLGARYELTERYFRRRTNLFYRASYPLARLLESWDLNLCFFIAFENCFLGFQFGKTRFESYFLESLRHEMSREAEKAHLLDGQSPLSLDNEVPGSEGECTFNDIVPADGEEPTLFVDCQEDAERLEGIGEDLSAEALKVARLRNDGLSYRAIAEKLGINIKKARRLYARYEECVRAKLGGSKGGKKD
jgi:DNA-directed RNA polymerase specialized sigma24 family protein